MIFNESFIQICYLFMINLHHQYSSFYATFILLIIRIIIIRNMFEKSKVIFFMIFLIISTHKSLSNDIQTVYSRLQAHFWQNDTKYKIFGNWQHLKGLYKSQVHLNIVDKNNGILMDTIRRKLAIQDENMFVTSFVLYGLLQSSRLGAINIDHHQFSTSLAALTHFKDKNSQFGLPQYSFWLQQLRNGTWSAFSPNLDGVIDSVNTNNKYLTKILNFMSFGLYSFGKSLKNVFCIPADIDDSSVNLILLGLMKETQSDHHPYWRTYNFNLNKFYNQVVLKYAYRPFDPSPKYPRANQIDPRSYYILRKFLKRKKDEAESRGESASVILPTTWILNTDQQIKDTLKMPFNVNNIDASVNINFLFGLLYQIHGKQIQATKELKQLARDTTDMLVYVIVEIVTLRPDILLLYYPSKFDFYWFVARTVAFLERIQREDEVLDYAYRRLSTAMRGIATQQLLKESNKGKNAGTVYWAQFLGNYGKRNRNQDATFSTALALNALLDAWGVIKGKQYKYLQNIPKEVVSTINEGIAYLSVQIKSRQKNVGNVFFSGSIKTFVNDFPFIFPGNLIKDQNGMPINAQSAKMEQMNNLSMDCMKGYIADSQYEQMLKMKWFQMDVPTKFEGYNIAGSFFPYWSSQSITEVMMLTALSKYQHINTNQQIFPAYSKLRQQ